MTDRPRGNRNRPGTFFINGAGIDREVITTDICRYLGNDALVRPGIHIDNEGQTQDGYYIAAYRDPTSAQLQDIRNDSAKWKEEKRRCISPGDQVLASYRNSALRHSIWGPEDAPLHPNAPIYSRNAPVFSSYNTKTIQAGPPTDSGYASASHYKFEHTQSAQAEDHSQNTRNIQPRPHIDENYSPAPNNTSEGAENPSNLELDDVRTVYSDVSSLPVFESEGYISELADDLINKMHSLQLDSQTAERISEILPGLLKAFALKIGYNAPTQMHRDVMFFIHKYRNDIVRHFKDRYSHEEESLPDVQTRDPNQISLEDRISHWYRNMEHPLDVPQSDINEMSVDDSMGQNSINEAEEENNMPELRLYRDFIFKTPAYKWLLLSLRRELLLTVAVPNTMEAIRRSIVSFLPPAQKVTRKKPSEAYKVRFEIEWCPLAFVKEQEYSEKLDEAVERAITLTGSAEDAQALTCAQYLHQTWPSAGEHIIRLVKDVVCGRPDYKHRCDLPDRTYLVAWIHASKFMVVSSGTIDSIAEIGEQLAWLGASLRSSPHTPGVSYCTPFVSDICVDGTLSQVSGTPPEAQYLCKIDFSIMPPTVKRLKTSNGQCWHNMFRNPVVVQGYPIRKKSEPNTGLEIPLNMMAGLARTRHANIFNGKLFIKGFSSMLVPTKNSKDQLIWHLLYNKDGHRISYLDNTVPHAENISVYDLEKARHVIGWCSEVRNYAGAPDAKYSVGRSRLPGLHAGCVLENISISAGHFIAGGVTFGVGNKDTPVHVSRNGYVPKLQWISKKFVVLWDEEDKRGWLVNGTSALLHLLRASLEYNKRDKFKSAFLFKPEEMEEASLTHATDSAIEVLLNPRNMKLKIYPDKGEMYDEETRRENSEPEEISKEKRKFLRLEDRIEHFYSIMEKIIDHQIAISVQNSSKVKLAVRRRLEGWDFMDLATDRDPLYPRVAMLDRIGKGWVDFARSIHAITLFGRGFGEIIQPADSSISCLQWTSLPKGKYYLAVCASDVKEIMDLDGDMKATPMKLSDNIIWYNPDKIFEPCQCKTRLREEHSDFVQVLLPSKLHTILPKMEPVRLEDRGAVIFGHNWKFKWYWKDTGDPEEGETPLPSVESETRLHDSGIESSPGPSAIEDSTHLSGSGSQLTSGSASSVIPLPTSATSEATTSNDNNLLVTSTQEQESPGSDVTQRGHQDKRQDKRLKWFLSYIFRKLPRGGLNSKEETQI